MKQCVITSVQVLRTEKRRKPDVGKAGKKAILSTLERSSLHIKSDAVPKAAAALLWSRVSHCA